MDIPNILTIREVSQYLRVDRSTVWRWCAAGKLAAFKVGRSWRIPKSTLDEFVEADLSVPEITREA